MINIAFFVPYTSDYIRAWQYTGGRQLCLKNIGFWEAAMKKWAVILAVLIMVMAGAFSAQADTVQLFGPQKVEEFRWTSPSGGGWKYVIGDAAEFATPSASVTWGAAGDITFKIYTNYPQSGISPAGVGVLALDLDHNGTFEKGVIMAGPNAGNVYNVAGWVYSTQTVFANGSYYYGGKFDQANPQLIPVAIETGGGTGQVGTVTWTDVPGDSPAAYLVTLYLSGFNIGGEYNNFNWNWSPATCGNADIGGHANVPLPPSVLLLGSGLLGLGLVGWRRRQTA